MQLSSLFVVLLALAAPPLGSQRPTPTSAPVRLRLDTPKPYVIAAAPPTFRLRVFNHSASSIRVLNVAKYGYLAPHFLFQITQNEHPVPLGGTIADLGWHEDVLITIPPGRAQTLVGSNRQIDLDTLKPGSYRLSMEMLFGYPTVERATSNTVLFEVLQR